MNNHDLGILGMKQIIIQPLDNTKDQRSKLVHPPIVTLVHDGQVFMEVGSIQNFLSAEIRRLTTTRAQAVFMSNLSHLISRYRLAALQEYNKNIHEQENSSDEGEETPATES